MELTEFLLARIAEDEAVAESLSRGGLSYLAPNYVPGLGTVAVLGRDRLVAECESKRQIVALHQREDWVPGSGTNPHCTTCAVWDEADYDGPPEVKWPCPTILILALPYADHPDFDPAWRP